MLLPDSINDDLKATEEALIAMREGGYYPFSSQEGSLTGIRKYNET